MDHADLLTHIRALLAAPAADDLEADLAEMEDILTVGYARALALEAERWRLERRIGEVAAKLADGDTAVATSDLAGLAQRMSDADVDLVRLRSALSALRTRASEARALV